MMSLSGSEVFVLKMALHRNLAMTKADVTLIVWLVEAADWMIGAADGDGVGIVAVVLGAFLLLPAVVVVPPLDPAPRRPPPLGVVAAAAGAVAVAALDRVAAWFAIPTHVTAPVLLLVILHPVVVIAGTTLVSAVIVVALVLLAVGGVAVIAAAAIVDAVAVMLMLRLTKSLMVLQLVISVSEGMEVVVDATACLWLTVTACALGPVPIKQMIEMSGRDCILPNLAQL
jgi:hypothetical protein